MPPIGIAFARAAIGMLTLTVCLWVLPKKLTQAITPSQKSLKLYGQLFLIACFEATLPFFLVLWGQQHIDSAIAALLMGTIPIFTVVILSIALRHRVPGWNILSIMVGFSGVVVLLLPGLMHADFARNIIGEVAILGAALSFSCSIVMIQALPPIPPIRAARGILAFAVVQMLPFVLIFSHPWQWHPSVASLVAIGILGVFGGGVVYIMLVLLIRQAGSAFSALVNYITPFIGVGLGIAIFHERFTWNESIALCLIALAMLLNEARRLIRFRRIS